MIKRKNLAQLYVLEAVSAIIIIVLTFLFVYLSSSSPNPQVSRNPITQLKDLGDDALFSLYNSNSTESIYSNLLVQYMMENDTKDMTSYINSSLPSTVSYNIWLSSINGNLVIFYPETPKVSYGSTARSHQIFTYEGRLYEVQLEMWYI